MKTATELTLTETAKLDAISAALNAANGRRRERTCDLTDVSYLISGDAAFNNRDGGRVANAYKYPATTTVVVVRKHRGQSFVRVNERPAKGGTGCGDVIHGNRWIGPTTAKGLRDAGFLACPNLDRLGIEADWLEEQEDSRCEALRRFIDDCR